MLPGLYRITQGVLIVTGHKNIGYDSCSDSVVIFAVCEA